MSTDIMAPALQQTDNITKFSCATKFSFNLVCYYSIGMFYYSAVILPFYLDI